MHGSYQNIEGGSAADVLSALTGAPYTTYRLQGDGRSRAKGPDHDLIWSELLAAEAGGFVMTAAVPDDPTIDLQAVAGLVEGHAYGILDVREAAGARLLKIRNPWGNTEWNGAWSDSSSNWTPALKKQLGWTPDNDGTFWMEYTDFKRLFSEVSIVRVRDSFVNTSLPLPLLAPGKLLAVDVAVTAPSQVCFVLHQSSRRCFPKEAFSFQYGGLVMELLRLSEPVGLVGSAPASCSESTFLEANVTPGRYMLVVKGTVDRRRSCAVSAYASSRVPLTLSTAPASAIEKAAEPVYAALAKATGTRMPFGGPLADVEAFDAATDVVNVLTYTNKSSKTFSCTVVCDLTNMTVAGAGAGASSITLAPGQSTTVVCRVDRPGESTGIGYKHEALQLR